MLFYNRREISIGNRIMLYFKNRNPEYREVKRIENGLKLPRSRIYVFQTVCLIRPEYSHRRYGEIQGLTTFDGLFGQFP